MTLVGVGVLLIGYHAVMAAMAREEVTDDLQVQIAHNRSQTPPNYQELKERMIWTRYAVHGGFAAAGLVLVILGACVSFFPLVATVMGFVVHLGARAILGLLELPGGGQLILEGVTIAALVLPIYAVMFRAKRQRPVERDRVPRT